MLSYIKENKMSIEEFKTLLKQHDWFYMYSDDPKVFRRGKAERIKIEEACSGNAELVALYHLHGKSLSH